MKKKPVISEPQPVDFSAAARAFGYLGGKTISKKKSDAARRNLAFGRKVKKHRAKNKCK